MPRTDHRVPFTSRTISLAHMNIIKKKKKKKNHQPLKISELAAWTGPEVTWTPS
jgi:hypothetical protein